MLFATRDPFWDVCLFFESLLLILSGLKFEPKNETHLAYHIYYGLPLKKKECCIIFILLP